MLGFVGSMPALCRFPCRLDVGSMSALCRFYVGSWEVSGLVGSMSVRCRFDVGSASVLCRLLGDSAELFWFDWEGRKEIARSLRGTVSGIVQLSLHLCQAGAEIVSPIVRNYFPLSRFPSREG